MSDILIRDRAMLINLKKCASTSLYKAFRGIRVSSERRRYQSNESVSGEIICAGIFFRNPYARLISVWKNLVQVYDTRNFYQPLGGEMGVLANDDFATFARKVLDTPDEKRDHHVQTQFNQFSELYDPKIPWFYGSVENIWEDWPKFLKFCDKWGISWASNPIPTSSSLEHHNRGKPVSRYETEGPWEEIHAEYKEDYDFWSDIIRG